MYYKITKINKLEVSKYTAQNFIEGEINWYENICLLNSLEIDKSKFASHQILVSILCAKPSVFIYFVVCCIFL